MSDARSQSRVSERRARQREIRGRIGRDPNTSPLRHLGTADDKFRRALHEVKKLADAYAAGKPNFDTDYANQVLSYALSETQFLTRRWKRACEREKRHGRAAGASGVTLEQLEKYGRPAEWCWFISTGLRDDPSYPETNPSRPGRGLKFDYRAIEISAFTIWHETLRNPIHAPYRRVNIRKEGSRKTRPVDVAEPWDNIAETQLNAIITPVANNRTTSHVRSIHLTHAPYGAHRAL